MQGRSCTKSWGIQRGSRARLGCKHTVYTSRSLGVRPWPNLASPLASLGEGLQGRGVHLQALHSASHDALLPQRGSAQPHPFSGLGLGPGAGVLPLAPALSLYLW